MALILTVVAVATSVISAVIGMGGGITLLAVLFFLRIPHFEIVALHGVVQMVSNGTRTFAYREHLMKKVTGSYLLGALPGTILAVLLVGFLAGQELDKSPWFKIGIAIWVFSALLSTRGQKDGIRLGSRGFALLGVFVVPLSTMLGATGPVVAPFFLRRDFAKEQIVCAKASCQIVTHIGKLAAIGFVLTEALTSHVAIAIQMSLAAILGTYIGKWLMPRVSDRLFRILYRVALAGAGTKILIYDGILKFPQIQQWLN